MSMRGVRLVSAGQPLEQHRISRPSRETGTVLIRIEAAGICRSDMHYRGGHPATRHLPITLGHEIAGTVVESGEEVQRLEVGDRVALHYLITCGACDWCMSGNEQFCATAEMLGKDRDGGYAEAIVVPERNAYIVPPNVATEHAAIMMCSTATAYHALAKGRMATGDAVAVFGVGGLGVSAVQLARAMGASEVFAVDIDESKLALASSLGATPIDGRSGDPAAEIASAGGVDIALDLVGSPELLRQCIVAGRPMSRIVSVGLTAGSLAVDPYRDLICTEKELIGCSDHLASEIPIILEMAAEGTIDLAVAVSRKVPLAADAVNDVLDEMERFDAGVRNVIVPG